MAEQFADAFRRYWAVIVTVFGITMGAAGMIYKVSADQNAEIRALVATVGEIRADIRELRAITQGNYARIEEFRVRTEGNRYTSQDAARDMDRLWDAINRLEKTDGRVRSEGR